MLGSIRSTVLYGLTVPSLELRVSVVFMVYDRHVGVTFSL